MSDARFAQILGSTFWLIGGAGLIASLRSGWTLFAPFAAVLITFGVGVWLWGVTRRVRG